MEKYKISVIMGIYNCADTLQEALDSLIAQKYKDFKVIMCDDASVDNTFQVAEDYTNKFENFKLIRNTKNRKLAATLNHCLEYVDTEYVARMDGDDISLPDRFEKEINFLEKNPQYALVSCPMIHFDNTGDWGIGKAVENPTKLDFRFRSPFSHAPSMIRTEVLREVGGYTDKKFTERAEDFFLWYKIYKKGYKGYNLQKPLYKMRDDKNAVKRRTLKSRLNSAKINFMVLRGLGVPNATLFSLLILAKAFVPPTLLNLVRKKRMNTHNK